MKERKESENIKEIPPPPKQPQLTLPSLLNNNTGEQISNDVVCNLKCKCSSHKTCERDCEVNRTAKKNVDQNMASRHCNYSSLQINEAGKETRKEKEGREGKQMENINTMLGEKKRLYPHAENITDDNTDEGCNITSARRLQPLPYQSSLLDKQKSKINIKYRDYYLNKEFIRLNRTQYCIGSYDIKVFIY